MNTLPFWLLVVVAGIVLWELIVRWPGDVSESEDMTLGLRGPGEPSALPRDRATSDSLTSSTVGRRAGRPIPRTAGTPFDWATDESFGDAAA